MTQPTYSSGLLFTRAHNLVRSRIYEILSKYGLSPSDWSVLGAAVGAPDGIRLARVAEHMDVKAPLVTMIANDLITKNLINRVAHHTDGRAKLLVATANGKKMAAQIEAELSAEIARLLKGASADQVLAFQKTLETIIANAQN